ncbi:hypothetical protein LTR37_005439 [Vermiconidia calcicola]|uniref:Uncharacterized protein n=1 Tax=Vermiconidia calcicola TaxID=1690605 RepID=A0ACC3NM47_9PEZI|nr:hypothetical protein LTR37_005439 [Vermiconidia calcicola]
MLIIDVDSGPFIPGIGSSVAGGKQVRFGNAEDLEAALQTHGSEIAAFMIETVEGNAGTVVPPDGYLTAVRQLCSKYNVLFIADEIQCGFGRTGYFMAYDCEGVKPDIVVLGKSLTGGACPMGLTLGSREAMGLFKPGQFNSTFAGNPLASACAIAAVDVIIDEKLTERAFRLGPKTSSYSKTMGGPANAEGYMSQQYGDRIRVAPALTIEEVDLWQAVDEIERALDDISSIEEEIVGHP